MKLFLKMRVISHNRQSSRNKILLVKSFLNLCELLFMQETLLYEGGLGFSDDHDNEFVTAFVSVMRKDDASYFCWKIQL